MPTDNPTSNGSMTNPLTEEELESRQREIEDESVAEGLAQYRRRLEEASAKGNYSVSAPGRAVLSEWIEPLANHFGSGLCALSIIVFS